MVNDIASSHDCYPGGSHVFETWQKFHGRPEHTRTNCSARPEFISGVTWCYTGPNRSLIETLLVQPWLDHPALARKPLVLGVFSSWSIRSCT